MGGGGSGRRAESAAVSVLLMAVSAMAIFSASWYLRRVPQVHGSMRTLLAPPLSEAELAAQAEVDEWCAPRLRTLPVTDEQMKRYRIVIAVDPPCHKQASPSTQRMMRCVA